MNEMFARGGGEHFILSRSFQSNDIVIPKASPRNLLVLALATIFARTLALLAGRTRASVPTQSHFYFASSASLSHFPVVAPAS